MKLKYQNEIDQYPCDLSTFAECNERIAYRWVHQDINNEANFLPVAVLWPDRPIANFTFWALSFFENATQARQKWQKFNRHKPLAYKILGTHMAEGVLEKFHGLAEILPDKNSHFNLLEYEGAIFTDYFSIVEQLSV